MPCCSGVAAPYRTTAPVPQLGDFQLCSAELRTSWTEDSTEQSDYVVLKGKEKVQDSDSYKTDKKDEVQRELGRRWAVLERAATSKQQKSMIS